MKYILAFVVGAFLVACGGAESAKVEKTVSVHSTKSCFYSGSQWGGGPPAESYWGMDEQCHDATTDAVLDPQPACCDPNQTFCHGPDGSSCGDLSNGLAPASLSLLK
jgi:hypothetical protein